MFSILGFNLDGFRAEAKLSQFQSCIFSQVFHRTYKIHPMPTPDKINCIAATIALCITAPPFVAGWIGVHTECGGIVPFMQWAQSAQFLATAMQFGASLLRQFIELYTR